jgi:hypothetical protein
MHLPLVGGVGTGDDLDQGRLAGAVLAEQAMNLSRPHFQVDAAKRAHAGKAFRDTCNLHHGRFGLRAAAGSRLHRRRRVPH